MNQLPKTNRPRIDGIAWFAGALIGVGLTTVLVAMEPTGSELENQYLAEHAGEFEQLRVTLDEMAALARSIPAGTIDSQTSKQQRAELKSLLMDFREPNSFDVPSPNAVVAQLADFPAEPDPYRSGRSVLQPSTFQMRGPADCTTLVDTLESLDSGAFFTIDSLKELHERLDNLRFVVLIRFGEVLDPKIRAESFEPGYQIAEAFCFDIREKRLLGGFSFEATTNDQISFSYDREQDKIGSALYQLGEQLETNVETAFWERLHEVVPATLSNMSPELPFSEESLNDARKLFEFRKAEAGTAED